MRIEGARFDWGGARPFALQIDRFALGRGERVLLTGPSGSGKSTLLSLVCGVVSPQAGLVEIGGGPFSALGAAARDRLRAERMGVIFQQFNLLPYASALDNVTLQLAFAPERRRRVGPAPRQEAARLLTALGLPSDAIEAAQAASLSVGQQQRVAAARALIGGPMLIVADEPTSALDEGAQQAFLDLLFAQAAETDASVLMVSHDPRLGPRFDRTLALDQIARAAAPEAAA